MYRWFNGKIPACHAGAPGSIPGRCISQEPLHFCRQCHCFFAKISKVQYIFNMSHQGLFLFGFGSVLAAKLLSRRRSILNPNHKVRHLESVKLSALNTEELFSMTRIFIFDCDGVIWKGDNLIDGAASTLSMLRDLGKQVFFMTNNSINSRRGYLKKFHKLGLSWVTEDQVLCSAFAAAIYFQKYPLSSTQKKVFVIGQSGIIDELQLARIAHIGGPSFSDKRIVGEIGVEGSKIENIDHDQDVEAVLVGFDSAITYYKIQYAQICLNSNNNCRFIATNTDAVKHITSDQEWAGSGAIVGAIRGCTLQEPIVVGKPGPIIVDYLCEKYKVDRKNICMIGDRLDTDILFGINNGLRTILSLSGCTTYSQFCDKNFNGDIVPTFHIDSIADLGKSFN